MELDTVKEMKISEGRARASVITGWQKAGEANDKVS